MKGVSLKVKKGGITALLGGNGAGKSTTLKSISNLLASERGEVTKGSVTFNNEYIHDPISDELAILDSTLRSNSSLSFFRLTIMRALFLILRFSKI